MKKTIAIASDHAGYQMKLKIISHLEQKGYRHYVNYNGVLTAEQLFKMGYGEPEYIHRVYRGWNIVSAFPGDSALQTLWTNVYGS